MDRTKCQRLLQVLGPGIFCDLPASLCASHSFELVQSRCLRLWFTLSFFAANPEREAKRQRFRFFPAFHALSTSSVQFGSVEFFFSGFPAFCERHKNHVVVVALRLVTLVLHLNDPPKLNYTKFFAGKVFCKRKSESERHSLWSWWRRPFPRWMSLDLCEINFRQAYGADQLIKHSRWVAIKLDSL